MILVPFVSLLMTNPLQFAVASSYSVQGLKGAIREQLGLETATPIILWKVRSCYNRSTPRELIRLIAEHAYSSYPSVERKDFADQIKNMQLDPNSDDPPGIV